MTRQEGKDEAELPLSPPDVFGKTWEERTRKAIGPTGWDSDLAVGVARDVLQVLSGELSEDEFKSRYHEAYLREFGIDLRPLGELPAETAPASPEPVQAGFESPDQAVEALGGLAEGDIIPLVSPAGTRSRPAFSRRTAIMLGGGGVAALLLGDFLMARAQQARAAAEEKAPEGKAKMRMGMVMDLERCDGCLMCVGACRQAYALPDGVFWIYVMAFKEPDRPDDVNLLVRTCQHCANAPCVKVCPTAARHRRSDGLVLTDYDRCFGCRYCQVACPYGVNYFGWSDAEPGTEFTGERRDARGKKVIGAPPRGVMGKCIFDPQRQDSSVEHGTTHCQMACPMGVIHFGDLNDPESEPNQYLRQRIAETGGKLSTFHLLDDLGTKPNVIYIGHQPSRHAEPARNPTPYEDWGFVNERRIVLEGPEPWFKRMFGR